MVAKEIHDNYTSFCSKPGLKIFVWLKVIFNNPPAIFLLYLYGF